MSRGDVRDEDLSTIRDHIIQQFNSAVESAKQQPMPTVEDLVTDVVA